MLELPETMTISKQIEDNIVGKTIKQVFPPTKEHKFCWYSLEPQMYDAHLKGSKVQSAEGFGIYIEMVFDNGKRLCFNDGINIRLISHQDIPKNYQLLIEFDDETALCFTVSMYGAIMLHDGDYDNEYYLKSKESITPFSDKFEAHYQNRLSEAKPSLSAKAFLGTDQRFPGIGNGTLQDILFEAGIHPKRKMKTLNDIEKDKLHASIISVLKNMAALGGRDTEKDIFGNKGGYKVQLSKNTYASGCPVCGDQIIKETYMGGSIYYCPSCQPLNE